MLFLQFVQHSSYFVGTPKNEISGAALELCQLKIKQFSPKILKFSSKREDNPFTLHCYMFPLSFLFIFHAGSRRLGSELKLWRKKDQFGLCFQTIFPFLMTVILKTVYFTAYANDNTLSAVADNI